MANITQNGMAAIPFSLARMALRCLVDAIMVRMDFSFLGRALLAGFAITMCLLNGCAPVPRIGPAASATHDRAFVEYWPADPHSKKLRLAVKDSIDMKGVITSAGSEYLAKTNALAERDAACLAIARSRGVQFVGKTNMSELAVATSGINKYFGTPRNPQTHLWHLVPGGSSSGSAVAVANNEADVAFGTDTAGSVRVPAACCGVVGLKTTYGSISLDGVYPIAPNQLDTVGPLARDVAGAVEGMDLLQTGFKSRYRQAMVNKPTAEKIRVGRLHVSGTAPSIDRAVDAALARTGFTVVQLSSEFSEKWAQAQKDAAVVAAVGAWLRDAKFETQPQVALRTKAIVALGGVQYQTAYKPALRRQPAWKNAISEVFNSVDFIALPTMQTMPPHLPPFDGTLAFELRTLNAQNTQAVNFAGVPALAVPIPLRRYSDLVTSLQLIGPNQSEAGLLNAGRLVESAMKNR